MLHTTQNTHKSLAFDSQVIEILLVDDQKLVRQELEQILSSKADFKIVGTASDRKEAIACLESLKPDVVLINFEMPGLKGIETASIVAWRFPECQILVLSSYEAPEYVQKAIDAGVDGYILKSTLTENLSSAIYCVYGGYAYLETQLFKKVRFSDRDNPTKVKSNQTEVEPKNASDILPATKKKYRSTAKWLVWSGLGVAIAVGGWWSYNYYFGSSVKPVPVEVRPVEKGTVEITVSESGKLELGEQQTLKSPKENATVERVNVTQGDSIEAGEALIVLRDRDTQEQEQEQEQKLENDKSVLAQEKNQKKILEAQEKVEKEKTLVRESAELFQLGYIAESELEEDREQLKAAKSELSDAEAEFDSAKLNLQHSQVKLASIQQKLKDRFVTSPINGVVLDVGVRDGDGITTDTKLLTIGDPEREIVELQLTTLNASKVKLSISLRDLVAIP